MMQNVKGFPEVDEQRGVPLDTLLNNVSLSTALHFLEVLLLPMLSLLP